MTKTLKRVVDLRSDAVTIPTENMLAAMKTARLGNDEFCEDPTIMQLEELSAELTGKEAGLFTPSSTMANLIAIMVYTSRGDKIIVGSKSHIYDHEHPGITRLTGIQYHPIKEEETGFKSQDLEAEIDSGSLSEISKVKLITIENSHNRTGGTVMNCEDTQSIVMITQKYNIPVYLDGARIFNAAVSLGVSIKELTKDINCMSFSISKAISAPVGSILVGSREFIDEARKIRWMLGGGMKQAGVLAAAGIDGLKKWRNIITEDHKKTKILSEGLSQIKGIEINLRAVKTNLILIKVSHPKLDNEELLNQMNLNGIKAIPSKNNIRLALHKDIKYDDLDYVINTVSSIFNSLDK